MTDGRTKIKITLNGSLVYFFNAWVVDQAGQDAILGMDFMLPAGICLDLAYGTICLPDEVRILLTGRRSPYRSTVQAITVYHPCWKISRSEDWSWFIKSKRWVRRDL